MRTLRLGTRGSALALAQSGMVARDVTARTGYPVELVTIRTKGDAIQDRPLDLVGGKGLFTKEIETALLEGKVDLAVHSLKDLPAEDVDGLIIGAVPLREDPRDAVVGTPISALASGSVVGTGSGRRRLQIKLLRPDLDVRGIRGNVDTRIAKQHAGEYDSVLLALAGLKRLGRDSEATEILSIDAMIPAPGQGALGIQCRSADAEVRQALIPLHDFATGVCTTAERAFLGALGAGCSVPAAGHCRQIGDGRVQFLGFYGRDDGELRRTVREGDADDAVEIGIAIARELLG